MFPLYLSLTGISPRISSASSITSRLLDDRARETKDNQQK